ncbi:MULTISPECIES: 1-acyl-sn-glycerol-3-phosphate acyltransferase [unclassified Leptolyngbya]|uniref:lysophospholipid acyltransferase family protein n=1 Tax=unclassified Leptolyngbya TaxID=2650499 RepID=UPI0016887DB5|nr:MULTISPECIES: 1-acyl-sn-glycerol-3-phosphate acyltransferase [unclassified Leptolyngbya]MBD1910819.1 1-acyl-sn-glycerol-3-phosphate acyltransferase [Leptolyngbya sp. FACHB-8]MBD2153786.1 1-acyl-sn-glycerol-3-phosphate acyltransferase [Leptolyngbya sp. FACHB-16]
MASSKPETEIDLTSIERAAPIDSRISPWLSAIAYPLGSRLLLPSYFSEIEVTGQENLPSSGPVILAPTHKARWDALIVPHVTGPRVTGRYLRFMVTVDEVKGIQGWFIRRLGGFPVNPRQPGIASLRYGMDLLRNQEMLVIFPEGGIFRDNQVHPLKAGLARLAIHSERSEPGIGTKIVPIHLHYDEEMPRWGSKVRIQISTPMVVADYLTGNPKDDAKRLTHDLRQRLVQLRHKCLTSHPELRATTQQAKQTEEVA